MVSVVSVVSPIATLASICMLSSPVVTVSKLEKQNSIGIMTPVFFCAQFVSCVIWSVYGVLLFDLAVILSNSVGTGIATYCLLVFLSVARQEEKSGHQLANTTYKKSYMTTVFAISLSFASSVVLTLLVSVKLQLALTLNGLYGSFCSVFMLSSPLTMAGTIIKNKNAEGLAPLTMSFALVNTFLWFLYGLLTNNPYLFIPQFLGMMSCIFQFGLLFKYGSKPSETKQIKEAIAPVPFMD